MAFTLAQLAQIEIDPLKKGVMMNLLRDAQVMEKVPFENVSSLQVVAPRLKVLPTGGAFRKVGGTYTEANDAQVDQVWESIYIFGGEIQFDRIFDKVTNTVVNPQTFATQLKLKSMALDFNNYFINGDHATDADGFEGLKKRIAGMPSRQTVHAQATTSTATGPTASATAARGFLDQWDLAWQRANGGAVTMVCLNEALKLGFGKVLRYLNYSGGQALDVTKDTFGREILSYKGAPLYDMGLKKDQSTEIITVTEAEGSGVGSSQGGAEYTSAYFVSLGAQDQGLTGMQLNAIETIPIAEGTSGPYKLLRVEWPVGLASFGSYGFTRLDTILDPASWA